MLRTGGWCRECVNKRKRDKRNGTIPPRQYENCQWEPCGKSLEGRRRNARYCSDAHAAKYFRQENPGYQRKAKIKHYYGMSVEQFDTLLADQGGACGVCKEPEPEDMGGRRAWWVIDHDHRTHKIRGILCNACNFGIGQFKDDPALLQAAANYLLMKTRLLDHAIPRQETALGARIKRPEAPTIE